MTIFEVGDIVKVLKVDMNMVYPDDDEIHIGSIGVINRLFNTFKMTKKWFVTILPSHYELVINVNSDEEYLEKIISGDEYFKILEE